MQEATAGEQERQRWRSRYDVVCRYVWPTLRGAGSGPIWTRRCCLGIDDGWLHDEDVSCA